MTGCWDIVGDEISYTNLWTREVFSCGTSEGTSGLLSFMATEGSGWDAIRSDGILIGWVSPKQSDRNPATYEVFLRARA